MNDFSDSSSSSECFIGDLLRTLSTQFSRVTIPTQQYVNTSYHAWGCAFLSCNTSREIHFKQPCDNTFRYIGITYAICTAVRYLSLSPVVTRPPLH